MTHIIGTDHCLQPYIPDADVNKQYEDPADIPLDVDLYPRRKAFEQAVSSFMQENDVGAIGEEAHPEIKTSASVLSERLGCQYRNIDMPAEIQRNNGIPEDYLDGGRYCLDQIRAWCGMRERYMYENATACRVEGRNLLVICGSCHVIPLADLFLHSGEVVTVRRINP
jgi:hypothetical protein